MSDKEAVYKLLMLLKEYRGRIFFLMLGMLTGTGLNLCIPLISRRLMDDGFIGRNQELLVEMVILLAVIQILIAFINVLNEKNRIIISSGMEYGLLQKAFRHLLRVKADYFDRTNNAEIMNIIYTDIGNMISIADRGMFFIVAQFFCIMGGLAGLFVINGKLALLVLLFLPLKYYLMKLFAGRQKKLMDTYIEEAREYAGWFGDMVSGIHEIKFFHVGDYKEKEFLERQSRVIDKKKQMNMMGQWNTSVDGILLEILTMGLYIVGANQIFSLQASIGSIFAFITYSSYVTAPISSILNLGYLFAGIVPSTKRFYEFMELAEESMNGVGEEPEPGELEFRNVSFGYEEELSILKNISLKFPRGSKTALVGKNGAGKTTMIKLITRMYQPKAGAIFLNGKNIEEYELNAYRSLIAIVSQQVYLFSDSIRNNILLYQMVEEEVMQEVLEDSGLWEFVQEVGLDYQVGRDGALLSGGQKQKIALARVFIQDKPIIIFDEATSNADTESELRLNRLFRTRLKEKTVIVITHRQEILGVVDTIVHIEDGEMIC